MWDETEKFGWFLLQQELTNKSASPKLRDLNMVGIVRHQCVDTKRIIPKNKREVSCGDAGEGCLYQGV